MEVEISNISQVPSVNSKTIAYIDLTFDKKITVKGFRVVNGEKGLFVSPPQQKGKDDKWWNTVWVSKGYYDEFQEDVIKKYNYGVKPVESWADENVPF